MRRIVAVCAGAFVVAACSGKDHSLGMGKAPTEQGSGGAPVVDMTESSSGGATQTPSTSAAVASGGARPSGLADKGVFTSTGASSGTSRDAGSGAGGGSAAEQGGATSSGGSSAAGGTRGVEYVLPVIPQITGDCPAWGNGTITFMGLGMIQIAVGTKPDGPTGPMLVYWHGTGSTSGEYAIMAAPVADGVTQAGGVIVSFQNTTGGDLYSGTSIFGVSDLIVVDQLVACAIRDRNVDPRKIYTMGCSAGGLFAGAMAAMRSSYVAAVETNSGGWVTPTSFQNRYTPPLMTVHGAPGSDVVILDFSQTSTTADAAFKARGGFAIDCNTGGGHCGGAGLAGDAWQFFLAHPYGRTPEPWSAGLPPGFSSQCKIQ